MHQKRLLSAFVLSAAFGFVPAAAIAADGDGMQSFATRAFATNPGSAARSRVTYADLTIGQQDGIFNPSTGRYAGGSLLPPQAARAGTPFEARMRVTYGDLAIGQRDGIFNPSTGRYVGGSLLPPQASRSGTPFAGASKAGVPM